MTTKIFKWRIVIQGENICYALSINLYLPSSLEYLNVFKLKQKMPSLILNILLCYTLYVYLGITELVFQHEIIIGYF